METNRLNGQERELGRVQLVPGRLPVVKRQRSVAIGSAELNPTVEPQSITRQQPQ